VEQFKGGSWSVVSLPAAGSIWTNLWGVTVAGNDVWAGQGSTWTVSDAPNPGSGSNLLGGVAAIGNQVWAAGIEDQGGNHLTLLMHHNA